MTLEKANNELRNLDINLKILFKPFKFNNRVYDFNRHSGVCFWLNGYRRSHYFYTLEEAYENAIQFYNNIDEDFGK